MYTETKNIQALWASWAYLLLTRIKNHLLFMVLLLTWFFAPLWLPKIDESAGVIDQGIWLLIILSLISFLLLTGLCWWLLQRFWQVAGLPSLSIMVSQFNTLPICQQLGYYWGSFALLLLAAVLCLNAIC